MHRPSTSRRRFLVPAWLPALLPLLLAACGGEINRPVVVSSFPAQGDVVPGPLQEIRIDFDDRVSILNPADVQVFTSIGPIPAFAFTRAGAPQSIFVAPLFNVAFPPDADYTVEIAEGLVVNPDEHYLFDEYLLSFRVGSAGPVLLGTPTGGRVVIAERSTFAEISSTPTPGGRVPVGLLGTWIGSTARVWVQLADGGGTGASLAWFTPGDAAMSTVALTHAGDLTADAAAIVLSLDGREIFAAWRDEGLGRVRLTRIDVATATETGSFVLSPAASAATRPAGLTPDGTRSLLLVACRSSLGDRLCQVEATAFVEMDRGPDSGVDGLPLPSGAGPVTAGGSDNVYLAPSIATDAFLTTVYLPSGTTTDTPSTQLGQPSALALTRDFTWLVEGLAGYAGAAGLAVYTPGLPAPGAPLDVSDDVGGVSTGATAVRAMGTDPFDRRILVLLDSDVVAALTWDANAVAQRDLDLLTDGMQAAPLPAAAAGADVIGFFSGTVPP